jgi:hypothetical protein
MNTVFQLFVDPLNLAHMVGLYLVAAIFISFMVFEFFSFVRFLIKMWKDKAGGKPAA